MPVLQYEFQNKFSTGNINVWLTAGFFKSDMPPNKKKKKKKKSFIDDGTHNT